MKLFPKIFIIFIFLFQPVFADILKKIDVIGNQRISNETVIMFSGVNINDTVTNNQLNDILKNLYDSNFFENVSVELIDNNLKISVKEFPIIDKIIYKGIKAKKIQDEINNNLFLKPRSSFNKFLFLEDQKKILETLKRLGYYFSTINSYTETLDENRLNIINEIELGEKAKIKKLIL